MNSLSLIPHSRAASDSCMVDDASWDSPLPAHRNKQSQGAQGTGSQGIFPSTRLLSQPVWMQAAEGAQDDTQGRTWEQMRSFTDRTSSVPAGEQSSGPELEVGRAEI